jgi:two-component sensor histidine kinase
MSPLAVRGSLGGPARVRTYAFILAMVLVGAIFAYTYSLVRSFERQTETLTTVFAKFCAAATYPATKNEEVRLIVNQVVKDINFPIVITDPREVPYTWKNIGAHLNPDDVSWEQFVDAGVVNPLSKTLSEVLAITGEMDKRHRPVLMYEPGSGRFLGKVHYGLPAITKALKWLPMVSGVLLAVFVLMGYVGIRGIVEGERRSIWIGMAKETAHQLGTPLSSLMGWLQMLKERCADDRMRDTVREMEKDISRLSKISSRFGKVGAMPRLDKEDVVEIVRSAVDYQKRRLPSATREIEMREHFGNVPKTRVNPDLLEWAVENLLKNALDAMDKDKGIIEVRTTYVPRKGIISIEVEDNGKGIEPGAVKKIFEPGYTTRKGGWGLGLPLARRVVEEYHHGRLRLIRTGPEGSLFVAEIPAAGEER